MFNLLALKSAAMLKAADKKLPLPHEELFRRIE